MPDTPLWEMHYPEHVQRYEFAARSLIPGGRVLDAGCGVGYGSALMADAGASVVAAVDLSEEALAIARQRYARPSIRWFAEDCHTLAAAAVLAPFDLACSLEILEHLADPERFLGRVKSLLARGGTFVASTPNRIGANRLRGNPPGAPSPNPFHVREHTVEEFHTLLAPHFEQVDIHVQTYDPVERMAFESALVALWNDPLLRLARGTRRALGRRVPSPWSLLPPRRWQVLSTHPGDELVITQLAVCHGPRP